MAAVIGYNHNIVKKAQEKALKFVQQGIWEAE